MDRGDDSHADSANEFALIAKHLSPLAGPEGLGLLDDAALYSPPSGFDLVITKDTMVEGVHFPNGHYGADTAEKLLRVNLSDLAAKGARPIGYLLSLCWPRAVSTTRWFPGFVKGLETIQNQFGFTLFGGDTVSTEGPLVISATFLGLVPKGEMVKRSGGHPGDDVWVTGHIGDSALGLKLVLGQDLCMSPSGEALWTWENAYYRPEPRVIFRKTLRKYAKACADVSDGLISDLGHIAKASQVSIEIYADEIPISKATRSWLDAHSSPDAHPYSDTKGSGGLAELIAAGDDYELIMLADPAHRDALSHAASKLGMPLTRIGQANAKTTSDQAVEQAVTVLGSDGVPLKILNTGFKHF